MICSHCGKSIPFGVRICPWCQGDTSQSQWLQAAGAAFLIAFGISFGFLGYMIGGFGGLLVGICVGAVVAVAWQLAWLRKRTRK